MAELITAATYWQQWQDKRWICSVFNNKDLNQVTWEQRAMEGDPKFSASQDIPNVAYHRFAEPIGLKGIFVDRKEDTASAWEEALAVDRPALIEFKTDPNIPLLPPHITPAQTKAFASVLWQGDPDQGCVMQDHTAGAGNDSAGQVTWLTVPAKCVVIANLCA